MTNRKVSPSINRYPSNGWDGPPLALFWDQSLVWGIICRQTLQRLGAPFHILSGSDIAAGGLEPYRLLLVPGGWAAHKIRALGNNGRKEVSRFIERGGSYLGFCGGAGMALSSPPSLELTPFERMPIEERLPNASGTVQLRGIPGHPAWRALPDEIPVSIWWPAQFAWHPLPRSLPLGFYTRAGSDFWLADLPFSDIARQQMKWEEWEKIYGINLDPGRLFGQPAILEVQKGKGRLILSYPHLETPEDPPANRMFLNVLSYLSHKASIHLRANRPPSSPVKSTGARAGAETLERIREMKETADDLIAFGERHLLWYWHLPWLLRWQRGIRGLEYGMLAVALRFLEEVADKSEIPRSDRASWEEQAAKLGQEVTEFCRKAKALLLEEKLASCSGNLSKLGKVNERVDGMRALLFGSRMNHGGLCRAIFDDLDRLLLQLLRQRDSD